MKTLRIILIGFFAGIAAGFTAAYLLLHQTVPATDEVRVRQISGEKITHGAFDYSGDSIRFRTISDGKGEAETEIPKVLIPEAYSWMNRVNSINVSYGYMFDRDGAAPYIGVMYGYRFGRVTLGGGVDLSYNFVGIKASAGICW